MRDKAIVFPYNIKSNPLKFSVNVFDGILSVRRDPVDNKESLPHAVYVSMKMRKQTKLLHLELELLL